MCELSKNNCLTDFVFDKCKTNYYTYNNLSVNIHQNVKSHYLRAIKYRLYAWRSQNYLLSFIQIIIYRDHLILLIQKHKDNHI